MALSKGHRRRLRGPLALLRGGAPVSIRGSARCHPVGSWNSSGVSSRHCDGQRRPFAALVLLCHTSKPYDKDDADGQQGAGEPERDECLAPVRAVANRIEDPDADAPRFERPNKCGDESKAERAESRRPGDWGSPNPRPQDDRTLLSSWFTPTYLAVIGPNDYGKIGPST